MNVHLMYDIAAYNQSLPPYYKLSFNLHLKFEALVDALLVLSKCDAVLGWCEVMMWCVSML